MVKVVFQHLANQNSTRSHQIEQHLLLPEMPIKINADSAETLPSGVAGVREGMAATSSNMETVYRSEWWRHFIAGAVAGCVSRTMTAPLDRVKVFLQVNASRKTPHTMLSSFGYLYREGGFFSLWRGNGINVLKVAPESAIKFMCYELIKRQLVTVTDRQDLGIVGRFTAGAAAGVFAQTAIYPLEVLKTRLALRRTGDLDHGLWNFAKQMLYREGLRCFGKGYVANCIGIIPYAGIDLTVYETLKNLWSNWFLHGKDPGIFIILCCGLASSSIGQIITYPIALVRTKLQARAVRCDNDPLATIRGQLKFIWRHEGMRGLYRGLLPNFMKVLPAVSITYATYEQCRKCLGAKMT